MDFSIGGRAILICLRLMRFFCIEAGCTRKTFAESAPQIDVAYGRRTMLAGHVLRTVGLALGGCAGVRLAAAAASDQAVGHSAAFEATEFLDYAR